MGRAELRFDICVGVSMILALIGLLIRTDAVERVFLGMVFLSLSVLTLWIGWRATEMILRQTEPEANPIRIYKRRYRELLLAEISQLWLALMAVWQGGGMNWWVSTGTGDLLRWMSWGLPGYFELPGTDVLLAVLLIPIPALMLLNQNLLRRKVRGDGALIRRRDAAVLIIFIGLFAITAFWRCAAALPLLEQIAQVGLIGGMKQANLETQLANMNRLFQITELILCAAFTASALRQKSGKKESNGACGES